MNNIALRGMVSGLLATGVLSIAMLIKSAAMIVPEANAIQALVKVSTTTFGSPLVPWVGWLEHFIIGTILWGVAFAVFAQMIGIAQTRKTGGSIFAGLVFSVAAWIVMMLVLMPAAGAGFFGALLGYGAPLAALVLHLIYGFSLGAFFGAFTPAAERREERASLSATAAQ